MHDDADAAGQEGANIHKAIPYTNDKAPLACTHSRLASSRAAPKTRAEPIERRKWRMVGGLRARRWRATGAAPLSVAHVDDIYR